MADQSTTNPFQGRHGPLMIAEIGGNHEGDFEYALKLTDLAIDSGADFVKFQLYRGDTLVSPAESPDRNAHFKKFELTRDQHLEIAGRCAAAGVGYMASVWDLEMLEWIDPHMPIYKIGSGDLTAYPVLHEFARRGKPMIVSTGLANLEEVLDAVAFIQEVNPVYRSPDKLAVLQCTSMYPIEDKDANLRVMDVLREKTGATIGYSDHTIGSLALLAATARGAQVLEFHFTDSREGKTFRDHKVSLTRDEVRELGAQLERITAMLGDGVKRPLPCEVETNHVTTFRRAVYCKRPLKAGEVLKEEDLVVLRPNHGVDARLMNQVVGASVTSDTPAFGALNVDGVVSLSGNAVCPLCGREDTKVLSVVTRRPSVEVDYQIPASEYLRQVRQCAGCGVYFNQHNLIPDDFYGAAYNASSYAGKFAERYARVRALPFEDSDNKHRAARLNQELILCGKGRGGRVLDVGMGLCVFLAEMLEHGHQCFGIDPDAVSVANAMEKVGVAGAHCGTLDTFNGEGGPFDLITFNKVLEHVADPVDALRRAVDFLSPDGFIYVELPDGDLALKHGSTTSRAEFNVEHLSIYNQKSILALGSKAGLKNLRVHSMVEPSGKCSVYGLFVPTESERSV